MRVLILSDIHANLEALTAVLDAAGDWDALWNLGDMVGYGGSPNQVLDVVRPLATLTVRGNHDRVCCGLSSTVHFNPTARASALWTMSELGADNLLWLRSAPQGPVAVQLHAETLRADRTEPVGSLAASADVPGAGEPAGAPLVTLAHGSPLNEDHYVMNMRDAWAPLQQMTTAITFIGHTHIQGGFSQKDHNWQEIRPRYRSRGDADTWTMSIPPGTRHLINPGSVGQPRDYDWRAAFAVYDTEAGEVIYRRVPYDVSAAQGRILMAGLPERLAARLKEGR